MKSLAERITGISNKEMRNYDFPTIMSKDEVSWPRNIKPRGNPRLVVGRIIGFKDREKKRTRLKNSTPKCFK